MDKTKKDTGYDEYESGREKLVIPENIILIVKSNPH
jgi:hypothetical protein